MTMLRDLLTPFQSDFSDTPLGRERSHWFIFTLLAIIVPFTSSMTSNLLRSLQTLFGLNLNARRFYIFMASTHRGRSTLRPFSGALAQSLPTPP